MGRGFWCVVCDGVGARGCLRGLHSLRGTPAIPPPVAGCRGGRDIGMVAVMVQPRTAAMVVVAVAAAVVAAVVSAVVVWPVAGGRWVMP